MSSAPPNIPVVSEQDPSSWWYVIHTKLYRYRALVKKYWWIILFTTCVGLAVGAWKVAQQKVVYSSSGRMMLSGKVNLQESVTYSEEMTFFMTTQREMMQDEAVRQRAERRVETQFPDIPVTPVELDVRPLAQTSIFLLTATGPEPRYPQKFLDAVMQEFINTRHEMRSQRTENVQSAVEDEITRVSGDLRKEEDKAIAFQKENNIGFLEQEGNSAGAYLSKLNGQLAELKREAQLLDLFEEDQKLDRDESRRGQEDANALPEGDLRNRSSGVEFEYRRARQAIVAIQAERASYPDLRPAHPTIQEFDQKIAQLQQLAETYRKQYSEDQVRRKEAIRLEIKNLEGTIKEWEAKALDLSRRLAEYNGIQANIGRIRGQLDSLSRTKGSMEIGRGVDQEVVSIRQKATPAQAMKPGVARTIGTGLALGLLAGIFILILIDQLDDRVASFTEFQAHFTQRVLSQIPSATDSGRLGVVTPIRPSDERHAFAEAFRSLRSSILFLPVEGEPPKILLITSAVPNEGKSTVAVNLAITMALSGARVLLVDGDLRRGEIHHSFGLPNERGFGDVLSGEADLGHSVQLTSVPGLLLLSRGGSVSNPGELFLSNSADNFLKEVHAEYDCVIIDSSPVMAADDTTSLAPKVDATIMVFRFTSSSARTSRKAIYMLRERQTNIIGMVCNDVSEAMQEYYYYRYPGYYGTPKSGKTKTIA